jgi:hypothetical protein
VKLLLEKGAELESKDNNGRTPLSWGGADCAGRIEGDVKEGWK